MVTGGPAEYQYDADGRLVGMVQNGTQAARYNYDPAGNVTGVTRYPATQLAIVSLVPAIARPETSVILHGTGFPTSGASVSIHGTTATVTKATATELTITVPSGATTGPVSVTANGNTVTGPSFTLAAAGPVISSITPSSSVIGGMVTITGSGFDPAIANDVVSLNGARVDVTAATASALTITVPPVASGRVRVSTPLGTSQSGTDLVIPPSGVDLSKVESSRRLEPGSAATAVPVTTAGNVAQVLFDAPASGRINLGLTASTFGGSLDVGLLDDRGRELQSTSSYSDFQLDAAKLAPGKTYQLVLRPTGTLTGQVTVTVSAPQTATLTTTAAGTAVTFTRAGQDLVATLNGTAGQQLSLGISPNTLTSLTGISVLRPDGSTLIDDSYISAASSDSVRFTAATTGVYTIVVNPENAGHGSLTITASTAVSLGTLGATGTSPSATLSRPGQIAIATFTGTAGQAAGLGLSHNTVTTSSVVRIIAPDGSVYVNDHYLSPASSDSLQLNSLPATG